MSAAPGWYRTVRDGTNLRYWDGAAWTQHTQPDPVPLLAPPGEPTATAKPKPVKRTRKAAAVVEPELPLPAPGWYASGRDGANLRWWDGSAWTRHVLKRGYEQQRQRSVPAEVPGPGIPMMGLAIFAFALAFALNVVVVLLLEHHGSPGGDAVELLAGEFALWIPLVLTPIWVSKKRGTGSLADDFGFRFSRKDWGIGIIGSFVGRGAAAIVSLPLLAAFSRVLKNPQVGTPVDEIKGLTILAFAFVACVGAPFVEELFFRGMIQPRLVGRFGVGRGIALTSLLFGSAHLIGWQGPGSLIAAASIAAGGGVLGYVKQRTGRLGTSMVTHMFFNLFVVAVVAIGAWVN